MSGIDEPLHVSFGGLAPKSHGPQEHDGPTQACVPMQAPTRQAWVAPRTHVNPLSGPATQSSSRPLQTSAGGAHELPVGTAQPLVQVPEPVDPQVVVHETPVPAQQA
jgi:hypothetical protein